MGFTQPRPAWMTCDPDKLLPKTFLPVPLSQALHDVAKNLFPPLPPLPALTEGLSTWHHPGSLRNITHQPRHLTPSSLCTRKSLPPPGSPPGTTHHHPASQAPRASQLLYGPGPSYSNRMSSWLPCTRFRSLVESGRPTPGLIWGQREERVAPSKALAEPLVRIYP